jgi:hypothetical protein
VSLAEGWGPPEGEGHDEKVVFLFCLFVAVLGLEPRAFTLSHSSSTFL